MDHQPTPSRIAPGPLIGSLSIHHADKGTQCTTRDMAFAAGNAEVHLSFESTGDAYDNAGLDTFVGMPQSPDRLDPPIDLIPGHVQMDGRPDPHGLRSYGCGQSGDDEATARYSSMPG